MKKIIQYTIAAALFAGLFYACEREDIYEYDNDPRLYFYKARWSSDAQQADSVVYSFFFAPEGWVRDTVYIDLRAMGLKTDYPRPFTLIQSNTGAADAAVSGKHYVPFDSEEIKNLWQMPAGRVQYWVPVILLKDPSLATDKVELKLRIAENEYFKTGIDTLLNYRVLFTSRAEEPANWSTYWRYVFGTWGERKMWFVMKYLDIEDFSITSSDYAYRGVLTSIAQKQLEAYNANNPTLTEADGTPVTF